MMDGWTGIDADTEEEALAIFDRMSPMQIRDDGDYEPPRRYYIEKDETDA